jgi:sugar phosphate isomerase/epimerase
MKMTRRHALAVAAAACSTVAAQHARSLSAQAPPAATRPLTSMGLCQYCGGFARTLASRQRESFDLFQPEHFFAHAQRLGAGGYQVALGILDPQRSKALREQAEAAGMYIEGIVAAPRSHADVARFDAEMKSAAAVGAPAVRSTIFDGRRYEIFDSLETYKQHDAQAMRSLELAAPIAEKYRVAFAPENHKDHRLAERVAALKRISSEFVGVCVDTGNNFSLLEDPIETVRALAPWAHSVHLKDQSVQLMESGFLLADIPLGQGFIDLPQIVSILQSARPGIHFTLELLTRDPLRVPCLEAKYWATFPDLPAHELARTLRAVRDHQAAELQYPSKLSLEAQVALEETNIRDSIAFARDQLGLRFAA